MNFKEYQEGMKRTAGICELTNEYKTARKASYRLKQYK